MSKEGQSNKKIVIAGIVFVVLIAVMAVVYFAFREKPVEGNKTVTIEVVDSSGTSTVYTVNTDAEYLKQAMDEADGLTYSGKEDAYGMVIDTVNGETADFNSDGAYWSFYVNDEYCNYGIDTQPIQDGDRFSIQYAVFGIE